MKVAFFGRWFRAAWLGTCVTGTIAPAGRSGDLALRWASVILYRLLRPPGSRSRPARRSATAPCSAPCLLGSEY